MNSMLIPRKQFALAAPFLLLLVFFSTIVWGQTPTLVTPVLKDGFINSFYSDNLFIGGPTLPSAVVVNGLPAGITFTHNGSGSVLISGTPTMPGKYPLTISATNASGTAVIKLNLSVVGTVDLSMFRPPDVTAVAMGGIHSCAVVAGGVQCWGDNTSGQLGVDDPFTSLTPVQTIAAGSGATAVATGSAHSCAVLKGGLLCWGWNEGSALGDGTTRLRSTPVQIIPANSGVTAVAAGYSHTCAVVIAGLRCWGATGQGQVGDGSTTTRTRPTQIIDSNSGVIAVATGSSHTCAIVSGGVKCWGQNTNAQLGDGTTTTRLAPVQTISAGSGVTALSENCAVIAGGVKCWGAAGTVGDGSITQRLLPVQVLATGAGVTSLTSSVQRGIISGGQTCALANGGVKCWGIYNRPKNSDETEWAGNAAPIDIIPAGAGVTDLAAGSFSPCVIVQKTLKCASSYEQKISTPTQLYAAGTGLVDVVINGYTICVIGSRGGMQCVNPNQISLFPDGTSAGPGTPVQIYSAGSGVTSASAAGSHICAVVNGGASCWGYNFYGQLGDGTTLQRLLPVRAIAAQSAVTAISAYSRHTCAIVNGGVQCWGYNSYGQLGDGSKTQRVTPVQTIPAGGGVTGIATGNYASCAVVNGGVQCWGANFSGQLGNGSATGNGFIDNSITLSLTPIQTIAANSGVTAISMDGNGACAIVKGGLQCWGKNYFDLVDNTYSFSPIPKQILPPNSGIEAMKTAASKICVVINGGVQCLGYNGLGSLGDGALDSRSVPGPFTIPERSGVTNIHIATNMASCAALNAGVVCWGYYGNYSPIKIGTKPWLFSVVNFLGSGDGPPVAEAVNRYRIYIPSTGGHLFTTDLNEYTVLTQPTNATYLAEGVDHRIYKAATTKNGELTVPYYRLYLKGVRQHFWTTDAGEYNILRAQSAQIGDEGIDGYLFLNANVAGTVPLYRLVLTGTAVHHWTTDANEFNFLIKNGWTGEGSVGNPNGVTGYVEPK